MRSDVDVWIANTAIDDAGIAAQWALLNAEERARADRLRMAAHRARFIAARAFLRTVLSRYVGMPPDAIRFSATANGKPVLAGAGAPEFNLSHSHDAAVCAIAGRRVGIDVEHFRAMPAALQIARRFFAPAEREALARVPPGQTDRAFFTCWTRKEAFIKGLGIGLRFPLRQFTVSIDASTPIALGGRETEGWTLHDLDAGEGYVGAVAVEASSARIVRHIWAG